MSNYSHTSPTVAVTVDIDYWSLKPKVRDIERSPQHQSWLAHLYDEQTGLKGSMKVCKECITVHVYHDCNGRNLKHGFTNCDTNRPPYHPSYIEEHYNLEPNNKYVQQAILRTHRRKLVPCGRHGILESRGFDPLEKIHRQHVPTCMYGSSPEYIIQGSAGLGTGIYYRRCNGKFRNLAQQVLEMGDEPVVAGPSTKRAKGKGPSSPIDTRTPCLGASSTESSQSSAIPKSPKVTVPAKRKRED